ncbi:MAG TPA: hypothetical protein VJ810_08600 [Blastocatellia bacterium]|nr:hypothetical protein [Blastocatellia bacterium]
MLTLNLISPPRRKGAFRTLMIAAALCCLFTVGLTERAAAQTNYTVNNGNGPVLRLSFTYYYEYPNCNSSNPENCEPQAGVFGLPNGDWIKVTGSDPGTPPQADIPDHSVSFPIEISVGNTVGGLAQSTRNKVHIDATLIIRPHYDSTGSRSHTVTASTTLGASNPTLALSTPFQWLDQDATLQVEVWGEAPVNGIPYTYTHPVTMRARKSLYNLLSPFLVPVAIVGRPPGNQSWSRLTVTSGGSAGLATREVTSNSVATRESYGFGPFVNEDHASTENRSTAQGVQQNLGFEFSYNYSSRNSWTPGEGDVMFCLKYPTFAVYSAAQDLDFRHVYPVSPCQGHPTPNQDAPTQCEPGVTPPSSGTPKEVIFPMRELLNPTPGSSWSQLTASENAAFRALNPLLGNPHATLPEPRYYKVRDIEFSTDAGTTGGSMGIDSIEKSVVENKIANSNTKFDLTSVTIPVGSILKAAGFPLPVPDATYRSDETTTTGVEFHTMKTLDSSSGALVEYEIADTTPKKVLNIEIYYDTYFKTFAFRDANTPRRGSFLGQIIEQYQLRRQQLSYWRAFRYEDSKDESPEFLVVGSLKNFGLDRGIAKFTTNTPSQPDHHTSILPGTGNVILANLAPGEYQLTIGKTAYVLTLTREGEATFMAKKAK